MNLTHFVVKEILFVYPAYIPEKISSGWDHGYLFHSEAERHLHMVGEPQKPVC